MKNHTSIALALALSMVCGINAGAQIYVSPTGNDSASGDQSHPLASLKAALVKARALSQDQKTVFVDEGTYFLATPLVLGPEDSGLSIKGKGPGKTIVSGGVELPGFCSTNSGKVVNKQVTHTTEEGLNFVESQVLPQFKDGGDGVWSVDLSEAFPLGIEIDQLFVNGLRATLARTPDEDIFQEGQFGDSPDGSCFMTGKIQEMVVDTIPDRGAKRSGFVGHRLSLQESASKAIANLSCNPTQLRVTFFHAWNVTSRRVFSISEDKSAVFFAGNRAAPWSKLDHVSQFIFEDDIAFLDQPGEWFFNRSTKVLYYIPREGESLDNVVAVVPSPEKLLLVRGNVQDRVNNVCVEGISFQYTKYSMPWRGMEPQQAAAGTDATVELDFVNGFRMTDCEVAHTGNNAVWLREACMDCELSHNRFYDLGIGAVKIGTMQKPSDEENCLSRRVVVDNNIFTGGGRANATGVGVLLFNASDCAVTHNEISDFYYSGVSVGWTWGYDHSPSKRNDVSYNHIHHIGWGLLSDMGGVYTLGLSEGTTVTHNVIHDIYSFGYGGWGLYTDEGSTEIRMSENLVYNCKSAAFHQHYGENNRICNNIFVNQYNEQLAASRVEDHRSFFFENNVVCFSEGDMYSHNWEKALFDASKNLYWNFNGSVSFNGKSLKDWQLATGKDKGSIIADPGFSDISSLDFTMKNKRALKQIGFKMFDPSEAGVYGSDEWKKLAVIDEARAQRYQETISALRKAPVK